MTTPNSSPANAPLVACAEAAAVVAFSCGAPVTLAQFLSDVAYVAAALPDSGHILNGCANRYHFTVGLLAAAVSGRISVLPSTYAPETIRQLQEGTPDVCCLHESDLDIALPKVLFPALPEITAATLPAGVTVPCIPLNQRVVTVFTSGTTGFSVGHHKTWGSLVEGARSEATRLGLDRNGPYTLVGTVPPQHMYGLESTIMLGLHGRVAMSADRPFYPQDIASSLRAIPRPRLLVTSPVHLRAFLASGIATPPVDMILCATAPLPLALAEDAERRLGAPLYEIYGATEAGQIASRRPVADPAWHLLPGLNLDHEGDQFWVRGGHVQVPALLNDVIEPQGAQHFLLHGRGTDVINVAGKRSSLVFLEQQLLSIPGVTDAAFYMPEESSTGPVARLIAFAVAPGLNPDAIGEALRGRIDPAFLPRPLYLVEMLPRLPTGKLPIAALQQLAATLSQGTGIGDG
ncbi:MAG TPA: AMP-binding protein [Acidiferrobacter sp.]|nr:AMP-binding protein [Acidiferrobacter sp.]